MKLLAFAGRFALFIAIMAFLTAVSLFVGGAYLASWPIMRISPRNRRLTALTGLAVALVTAARAYDLDKLSSRNPATDDTEATDIDREGVI